MSRMLANIVCLEKTLLMFVLLTSLLLVSCVSGDGSRAEAGIPSASPVTVGGTDSQTLSSGPTDTGPTLSRSQSDPTQTTLANQASTALKPGPANTHSPIASDAPGTNSVTNVTSTSTTNPHSISNATSTENAMTHPSAAPNGTSDTEKSEKTSRPTSIISSDTNTSHSSGRTTETSTLMMTNTSLVIPNSSEKKNSTSVQQSSTMSSTTPASAPEILPETTGTVFPMISQENVSSTTPESNTTMPTANEIDTTSQNSDKLEMKSCKNNDECKKTLHLMCNTSSGHCVCMEGYSPMSPNSCGKKLGAPCDEKCDAQNSFCGLVGDKYLCMCEFGLTASADGNFCYGKPLIHLDTCDHNANCTDLGEHMECRQFACVCKDNYIRQNSTCKEKIDRLDAPCNGGTQVCYRDSEKESMTKRICFEGFCRCNSMNGFVPHDGICKSKISLLGAPCNTSTHVCHRHEDGDNQTLHCQNGICQCKDMFLLEDGKCKKKIGILGGKCSSNTEICHVEAEGYHQRRECINGTCQCKGAFTNGNGICKQKISLLGAPCNATSDVCYFQEDGNDQKTHCNDGVCRCKDEFALTNKKCQKEKSSSGGMQYFEFSAWILLILVTAEVLQ